MIKYERRYPIGRIYVERKEFPSIRIKDTIEYFTPEEGGKHLYNTLKNHWDLDTVVDVLITPGGFIREKLRRCWVNEFNGWDATPDDIMECVELARNNVEKMLKSYKILDVAKNKIKFLSIGSDIRYSDYVKAELVFIIDVDAKKIIHWTGKSFPYYEDEEDTVIQVTDLCTHFIEVNAQYNSEICNHRIMILGCHDLSMYHPRGKATAKGNRKKRRRDFYTIAGYFKPNMAIHHPHVTINSTTWRDSWNNLTATNTNIESWASGISYYKSENKIYHPLCDVLKSTRSCTDTVLDIKLESGRKRNESKG